ncbi:hypothetical protein AAM22_gp45 [Pantoea phage vB_PagM_AAM22]|nr:hypothetical protein AAM22_gp45 [Pantoea phage vB_PagM_AAM22]
MPRLRGKSNDNGPAGTSGRATKRKESNLECDWGFI